MQTKFIEIRDRGTCIAAMAIRMVADDSIGWTFLSREGYPKDGRSIVLMRLSDQRATVDPYAWPDINRDTRTMPNAHDYIIRNWASIESGSVVDVRVILGETVGPAEAEIGRAVPA